MTGNKRETSMRLMPGESSDDKRLFKINHSLTIYGRALNLFD